MARRLQIVLLALVALALLAPAAADARIAYPKSIAATGDSLTRAAGTGFLPWTDNPAGSWSTGTEASVSSHYLRLLALNEDIGFREIEKDQVEDIKTGQDAIREMKTSGLMPKEIENPQVVDYVSIVAKVVA